MTEQVEGRQRQILEFLRTHGSRHSYPPTVREIGQAVGLSSSSTVQNHLNALETKGLIRRDPTKSRTVEVVGAEHSAPQFASNVLRLPLVGRVAAGTPVLAEENVEDHISVGPEIAGGDDAYALTVHGDSMIGAGINDGDIVLVRPRRDAPANGTIVVARIENETTGEGEVTVKRFFREAGRVRLQPENSALQPIYPRDLTIEGVVTAVIRVIG
ncbi:MAG TPA: transcriptional repressor LexA [Candidatus Dormibacteraeota bacterium]|jgi:repressor LexA|nr:transcriptional repressor LexA [Candidatus Dormibacteraeota bacterium]